MKILELTNYSAGGCGVFARVKQEAQLLAKKGHEVAIFSSNLEKGTNRIVSESDKIGKVKIKRFPATPIKFTESYMISGATFIPFKINPIEDAIIKFKPNIIIAHGYRHTYTHIALNAAEKIKNCKTILVTHAPFKREKSRSNVASIYVNFFDEIIGPPRLRQFDKIFIIANWERHYLSKLGVDMKKVEYVPNGINENYFSKINGRKERKIIYTGRVAPIKNLEVVIKALKKVNGIDFEIFGPAEKDYLNKLNKLIEGLNMKKRVKFILKTYDRKEHIKELDKNLFFILPSFSEGMPQSLIEAMARKCIVIGSDNLGNTDLIDDEENGFLFKNDDGDDLVKVINKILSIEDDKLKKIGESAKKSVEQFKWSRIIDKIDKLIKNL